MLTENFLSDLDKDGIAIVDNAFNTEDLIAFNKVASKLPPFVGHGNGRWLNDQDVLSEAKIKNIDWAYHWAQTPKNNLFINTTMLPLLKSICDVLFGNKDWGWQLTNRYIMSNYKHDYPIQPHLDAPYLWPQKLECEMSKYLDKGPLSVTFMIPLVDFTIENGATAYVPGTHRYRYNTTNWNEEKPFYKAFFENNYVQPPVSLGGFGCFYGNVLHSIMPNKTNQIRRGIIFRGIRQDALNEMQKLNLG